MIIIFASVNVVLAIVLWLTVRELRHALRRIHYFEGRFDNLEIIAHRACAAVEELRDDAHMVNRLAPILDKPTCDAPPN